ncbi:hypothetical protein [Bifidobacterium callitrichidarum]|uniref:Uncharacterized protein n=1 Tax=Bifidobacterium callitrichidarum TaxID=2052941 RepID=A0A2U2NC41_9BIFI|nr:hypothetical protein [Bifidobacterium callitrichidarum]PWG66673.1 hypothetical protein DF196_01865 [Bifidobacterium callitrichidarum]
MNTNEIPHRNPVITTTIQHLITEMPDQDWTPATPEDLDGKHVVFSLAWHTSTPSGHGSFLTVPAAGEDGEPYLIRLHALAEGGMLTELRGFNEAETDLRVALFNLICGFDD